VLVAPTRAREVEIAGDRESWDFGVAAGFYVDATDAPWATNYRMYSYVVRELFSEVMENFPVDQRRVGIFGHSMGGHGALVIALRNRTSFDPSRRLRQLPTRWHAHGVSKPSLDISALSKVSGRTTTRRC
jgi:acetyl esterase/lipase